MKLKGLYQKTDSRIWYYQPPMAKGVRPKPISLGTKDPEEAVALYYSVAATERTFAQVLRMLGNREVITYSQADMRSLRDQWLARGLSPRQRGQLLRPHGRVFSWAVSEGLTKTPPSTGCP